MIKVDAFILNYKREENLEKVVTSKKSRFYPRYIISIV